LFFTFPIYACHVPQKLLDPPNHYRDGKIIVTIFQTAKGLRRMRIQKADKKVSEQTKKCCSELI
jgi:hypothetical protein